MYPLSNPMRLARVACSKAVHELLMRFRLTLLYQFGPPTTILRTFRTVSVSPMKAFLELTQARLSVWYIEEDETIERAIELANLVSHAVSILFEID